MSRSPYPVSSPPRAAWRLFVPILAGATLRERLISCLGALIGIGMTGLVCGLLLGRGPHLPLLVAPMGASAVLLFAVPASPLAQPWSIIGGNTLSALCGFLVGRVIHDPVIAAGAGVAIAIAVMSFTRCLHPPGGAAALTAVLGGPAVASWGALFPLVPVALNSCILVGLGLLFHRLSRRGYPHAAPAEPANTHGTADPPPALRVGFRSEDIDAALARLGETFDIDRDDIDRLLREVELQAAIRAHGHLLCVDIMSRDIIGIRPQASREEALSLLLGHNIRTLPVTDEEGRLLGTVGLRELLGTEKGVAEVLSAPATASPASPAVALLPVLTDGRTHAVIVTDAGNRVLGLISQTDLLSAMGRLPAAGGLPLRGAGRDVAPERSSLSSECAITDGPALRSNPHATGQPWPREEMMMTGQQHGSEQHRGERHGGKTAEGKKGVSQETVGSGKSSDPNNFANDRERAAEAGRKGGQNSHKND